MSLADTQPSVISIQVGRVRDYDGPSGPWRSAIAKAERLPRCTVGVTGVVGDAQADLVHHGGVDKAVMMFAAAHYARWNVDLGRDLEFGSFGENFTAGGLIEEDVCIGDTVRIGRALLECSQPRQPCWKLSRHLGVARLAQRVEQAGTTGWYYRVIEPGIVRAGDAYTIVDRPNPGVTIGSANATMHTRRLDRQAAATLLRAEQLSDSWKTTLTRRLAGHDVDLGPRHHGPAATEQ